MPETNDAAADEGAPLAVDPLADLLFNLVAIIVVAVIVILPAADATPASRAPASVELKIDGRTAQTLVATAAGIRFGTDARQLVPLHRVLDDEELAKRLERMRDQGDPLLVLIEPDGMEAAFLLEAVASAHGPAQLRQVRLDRECAFARSAQGRAICPVSR